MTRANFRKRLKSTLLDLCEKRFVERIEWKQETFININEAIEIFLAIVKPTDVRRNTKKY